MPGKWSLGGELEVAREGLARHFMGQASMGFGGSSACFPLRLWGRNRCDGAHSPASVDLGWLLSWQAPS